MLFFRFYNKFLLVVKKLKKQIKFRVKMKSIDNIMFKLIRNVVMKVEIVRRYDVYFYMYSCTVFAYQINACN